MTTLKLQAQAAYRQNFYLFVLRVLEELFPSELNHLNIEYLEAMCRAIQDVMEGRTSRLLITIPPRHLKSTCACVALPAFILGHHPEWEVMVISYSDDLLRVHSEQFRQIINSRWYRRLHQDATEPLLAGDSAVFFVPVPTNDVRRKLEAKRQASITNPQHADEARDAPMNTMENVLRETRAMAIDLGLVNAEEVENANAYDATIYSRFFQHMLKHRNCRVLTVEVLYPGVGSAHDLDVAGYELMASSSEVANSIAVLENALSADEINQSVENWYQV